MKFLIDAQLPMRLTQLLREAGDDTIHTSNLPQQNATPDSIINLLSIQQERVVITKDSDFVDSFLTMQQPYKLLLNTTGNIKNSDLETLFTTNPPLIVDRLSQHSYIELSKKSVIVHQ
jgi:predicted nuclease of predicted toxin-antitoxin system